MESGMGQMVAEGADINSSNLCREGKVTALKQKRRLDAERREQLLYQRAYTPENYGKDGLDLSYFSHIPVALVRQLVAEGLLDLRSQHSESPSVEEMLTFCSGADEAIWFFHGFTVGPERIDCRVTLEGFESFTAPTPERIEEFLRFNRRGETEVSETGACWCWYD